MPHIVKRKDKYIEEMIAHFDEKFLGFDGDVTACWDNLLPDENDTLNLELERIHGNDPDSVRYYLENYHVIATKGDEFGAPELITLYPFWESQEILWEDVVESWAANIPIKWILLKARQIGWSTIVQAMIFYRTIFNELTNSLVIADERIRSSHIFDMSRLAYDCLPWWLRPEIQYEVHGEFMRFDRRDKKKRLERPGLRSNFFVDAANKPTGSSRGFTLQNGHLTEISLWRDLKILTRDLFPAATKGNRLSIWVMEGTAEGIEDPYHRLYQKAEQGALSWRPKFCPWWKQKEYSKPFKTIQDRSDFQPTDDEKDLIIKIREDNEGYTLSREQLNWRRETAADFEAVDQDSEMVEQEYPSFPEAAFRVQGTIPWEQKKLRRIQKKYIRKPIWFGDIELVKQKNGQRTPQLIEYLSMNDAPLWIWEFPKMNKVYYGGADPGQGVKGKDYSSASMWRVTQSHLPIPQVAEWRGHKGGTPFARRIAALGFLYNTCQFSVEYNIQTVLESLLHHLKYPNLYRWRWADKTKGHLTNYFGWVTQTRSRTALIDNFKTMMDEDLLEIRSQRLLNECWTFIDVGDDRYEARLGTFDDTLFAAMIATKCLGQVHPDLLEEKQSVVMRDPRKDFQNTDYSPVHDKPGFGSEGDSQFNLL